MKKFLLLFTLLITANVSQVFAQDTNQMNKLETEIEAKRAKIQGLENQLEELTGDLTGLVGDTFTIDFVTITLLDAKFTNERVLFEDIPVDEVLKLTYEITNKTGQEITYSSANFGVYVDDKITQPYPLQGTIEPLGHMQTGEGIAYFPIIGDGSIEVEWQPMNYYENERALWKIEL